MLPSLDFSPWGPRQCQRCQRPLSPQARSDQQYCSDRCRGLARRHGTTQVDWPARAEAAEQRAQALQAQLDALAQAQQAAEPYERRYEELSGFFILLARDLPAAHLLPTYLNLADQLLLDYQQHPGLVTGEVSATRRLASLQHLRTGLGDVYQALLNLQAQELQWKERPQAAPSP